MKCRIALSPTGILLSLILFIANWGHPQDAQGLIDRAHEISHMPQHSSGGADAYDRAESAENVKSDSYHSAYNRGQKALNEGRYADAESEFVIMHRLYPDDPYALLDLSIAYAYEYKFEEAVAAIGNARDKGLSKSRFKEELSFVHRHKAESLIGKNDTAAEAELRIALALTPKSDWAWNELGIALVRQGKYFEAIKAYQQAIKLDASQIYKDNLTSAQEDLKKAKEQEENRRQEVNTVISINQMVQNYNESIKPPKTETTGLGIDDDNQSGQIPVQLGTPVKKANLQAVVPTTGPYVGKKSGDQLLSAAAIAKANGDLGDLYDKGRAPSAGSLDFAMGRAIDPSTFSTKVRNDKRMIAALKDLDQLQAIRSKQEDDLKKLTAQWTAEHDPEKFKVLQKQVDQANTEYQSTVAAVSDTSKKIEKLHRTIDDEVEAPPSKQ